MNHFFPKILIKCSIWDAGESSKIEGYIRTITESAIDISILPKSLIKIIVAKEYEDEYKAIAVEYGLSSDLVYESEYHSVAKMCFNKKLNNSECTLLIHAEMFTSENFVDAINTMFLTTIASDILPEEFKKENLYYYNTPVSEIATVFFPGLFELLYAQFRMPIENRENLPPPIAVKDILAPFRRKVKRLHLKHQADGDFEYCVVHYYGAIHSLLKRFIQIFLYRVDYAEFLDFEPILDKFGKEFVIQFNNIISHEQYSLDFLQRAIVAISDLCFFEIKQCPSSIKVKENPKRLFPDLVDTHQRIVAFVDILGFSNLIQLFDQNDNIGLLTDIKESLDLAIKNMNSTFVQSKDEIETKLFSDCLCLSVPFFDNDSDFSYQFAAIMLGIKTYQSLLLVKGYLVRGGITIGSYYSDGNMIFSGALVEAVNYEKNGATGPIHSEIKPPRILVSPVILQKLDNTKVHSSLHLYYVDGLIRDLDNEVFVNPVFDMSVSAAIFDIALNTFNSSDDNYIKALSPVIDDAFKLLKTFMSPETEKQIFVTIINKLNENIEIYCRERFVSKYLWMKDVVNWIRDSRSSSRFSFHKVLFKEVTD